MSKKIRFLIFVDRETEKVTKIFKFNGFFNIIKKPFKNKLKYFNEEKYINICFITKNNLSNETVKSIVEKILDGFPIDNLSIIYDIKFL